MKKTQRKDAWENIRKQRVSFLSIVVISAMAVMAYLGLNFASRAIKDNADGFYADTGFRDAEVVSTLLLTPEDLVSLRETEGVAEAEALWQTSGTLLTDGEKLSVNVLSLTERVNTPLLRSGRLPEAAEECLVDGEIASELGLSLGDVIRLEGARYLREGTFTVCGIVLSGEYATNTTSTPGNRNVTVLPEAFDLEALEGCSMKALLRFTDCEGVSRFDQGYLAAGGDTLERVRTLSEQRAELRTAEVRETYGKEIAAGEQRLAEAAAELSDARRQLTEGWAEYRENEALLAEGAQQLAEAKAQLEEVWKQLSDGQIQLGEGSARLQEAEAELLDALAQLTSGQTELDAAEARLVSGRRQLTEGWEEYRRNEALLEDARQQLADGRTVLEQGETQLEEAGAQLEEACAQLTEGWAEYREKEAQLAEAKLLLEDGKAQLEDGCRRLEEAWAELEAAKRQLDDGEAQYALAARQLADAEAALDDGAQELSEGKQKLMDGAAELEAGKNTVRSALKSALDYALGQDSGAYLDWAPADETISVEDPNARAVRFPITGELTLDLSLTMAGNLANILTTLTGKGITETELRTWIEGVYGAVEMLPEESFIKAAARMIAETYGEYDTQYEYLADGAREWDEGHARYIFGSGYLINKTAEYTKGLAEYRAARQELDEGWEKYDSGLEEYQSGLAEYTAKQAEYEEGLAQYLSGAEQLKEALGKLEQGDRDYAAGLEEYEAGKTRLAEGWEEYSQNLAAYQEGIAQLAQGLETLESKEGEYARGRAEYLSAKTLLEEGWEEYGRGLAQYEEGRAEYEEKLGEYDAGLEAYNEGLALYEEKQREYAEGQETLAEGLKTLEQGEADYAGGEAEYLEGVQTLEDARRTLDGIDECRWVILDMRGNASYQTISSGAKNVADMGMTFALIFILVGALVIYATLGRIVEEQRRMVGATKALGLYRREVLAKYLCFGVGATALGVLLGVVLGYFCIQPILLDGYGQFYNYNYSPKAFLPGMTLAVLAGGLLLSAAAVYIACAELLRTSATGLMQEKAPSAKQRGGRWMRSLPLYTRMILLNVITDKKRVAVTVVSVAGCCALLVGGLTMRSGIMAGLNRQFSWVARYDYLAVFSEEEAASAISEAREELEEAGAKSTAVLTGNQLFSVGDELNAAVLLCGDLEEMQTFFRRLDPASSAALPAAPEGVWLRGKDAEVYGLEPGDTLTLYDGNMKSYSAMIAGIYENYVGRELVMSRESYRDIFGAEPEDNALLVLNGGAEDRLVREILTERGLERLDSRTNELEKDLSLASILNLIALLMIGIAGIMACFILLNLISMHVNQKKKELTIMRVNGFTVREVIAYIVRETVVTNLLGILLGLGAGMFLGYRTICLIEGRTAHFVHSAQPLALVGGVLITAVFSVILNAIALRKVKRLKLTDVA